MDISTLSRVAPITVEVAGAVFAADANLRANARSRGLGNPGLSDAVILALARTLKASVLAPDPHFEGSPETLWMGS